MSPVVQPRLLFVTASSYTLTERSDWQYIKNGEVISTSGSKYNTDNEVEN